MEEKVDAKDVLDKAQEVNKELPMPRFKEVSALFDKLDKIMAEEDSTNNFSLFEFELLALMFRKKIEHMGLNAILAFNQEESDTKGNPNVYQ